MGISIRDLCLLCNSEIEVRAEPVICPACEKKLEERHQKGVHTADLAHMYLDSTRDWIECPEDVRKMGLLFLFQKQKGDWTFWKDDEYRGNADPVTAAYLAVNVKTGEFRTLRASRHDRGHSYNRFQQEVLTGKPPEYFILPEQRKAQKT